MVTHVHTSAVGHFVKLCFAYTHQNTLTVHSTLVVTFGDEEPTETEECKEAYRKITNVSCFLNASIILRLPKC